MSNDTDHRFVADLMDLVQKREDDRVEAKRTREVPSSPRRILDIVLWSSITNLMLLGVFVAGWNFDAVRAYVLQRLPQGMAAMASNENPPPVAQGDLHDNELLTQGPQRQLKGPLQITLVPSSTPEEQPVATAVTAPNEVASQDLAGQDAPAPELDQGDGSGEMTVGPEDPAAQLSKSPVLRKGQGRGEVEIGNFATVSLPGSSDECLDTAYGLLDDVGAPRDRLKVLAESRAITVARICAANGSLVVTCRLDQITISPRKPRPDDTCTG